ncbi:MAG: hypothetical protein HDR98_08070 [Bacteroides sp.]|nr:hypothetical protein [Bacteroides sp.]
MKKISSIISILLILLWGCSKSPKDIAGDDNKKLLTQTDSIALYRELVSPANDEYDIPECALFVKNKTTGIETEILRTVRPDWHCWYIADGEVPIDSIAALSRAYIWNEKPLQLIVEGCPDSRNEFSYFVDVPSRKAWYVPANSGYMGGTEEGYMIFRSYRYASDPEIAGRYTFIQVFNQEGKMGDSLDLEHVILSKYQNGIKN